MSEFPWKLVTTDIDGTLTTVHGWKVIAEAVGRSDSYQEIRRRFASGQVGEEEHLRELLGLAVGARRSEVEGALARTSRIAGISEAIRELHGFGARVALLTHNPGYVCRWYQARFGFDDFAGTPGAPLRNGRIAPIGRTRADKRMGMRSLLRRHRIPAGQAVHLGDAVPDAEVFPMIGGGVALNSRNPDVERVADLVVHTGDLRVLVGRLRNLRPRNLVNDA